MRSRHMRITSSMSLVVALHAHRVEDQRALFVDVAGRGMVRRRQRVAAVGLVRLAEHREAVYAVVVDDRHEQAVVGGVRVAVVGRVVQERVAASQLRVQSLIRARHQVGAAHDVDRQALGGREELGLGGQDAAGEVTRRVQDARAAGRSERVLHRSRDALRRLFSTASWTPSI